MDSVGAVMVERELPCALTDEEVLSRGRMLGETISKIDELQEARTSAMKRYRDQIEGLVEQQRKLAVIIRDRVETRLVRCGTLFHSPAEGMKRIIRMDTGEVVGECAMTDAEKQLNMFAAQGEFEQWMAGQQIAPAETKTQETPEDESASSEEKDDDAEDETGDE